MKNTRTIELAKRGIFTLPKEFRDRHDYQEGSLFSVVDCDGVFIISPKMSQIDHVAEEAREKLEDSGLSLDGILSNLRKLRRAKSAS